MIKTIIESKNVHMEHLEDIVIKHGVVGARQAINFLQALRDALAGRASDSVNTTVKWDGAPAIIVGRDEDDKLFVATKSYFSKNSISYKTSADIRNADLNPDLADKLLAALTFLQDLKTDRVLQGDFLFTSKDLKIETIDGEESVVFHPNTIAYTVPVKSKLGKEILQSNLGIVFHTAYSDEGTSYDFNIDQINKIPNVWLIDANYKDVSGTATFNEDETKELTDILSNAGKAFRQVDSRFLNTIAIDKVLVNFIQVHHNLLVRDGKSIPSSTVMARSLKKFLNERALKEIAKLKTDLGKERKKKAMANVFKVSRAPINKIAAIIELQKLIIDAKLIIIDKMNQASKLKTFLKTSKGYKLTGEEGYVAVDRKGNAVKLVDRLEFSYANFSNEVIKGWTNDSRR